MKAFNNLRQRAGRYFLRKKLASSSRSKKLISLRKASSVGILFELTDEKAYRMIQDYIAKLQGWKIKVKAVGFTRNELVTKQFLPVLSFDFILKKHLNWYGRPKAKCTEDFIQADFDICINVADPDLFPLKYIAAMSKAKLRVGPYRQEDENIYDLMIQTEEMHNQEDFLNHVHEYLTILNPRENA